MRINAKTKWRENETSQLKQYKFGNYGKLLSETIF